MPPFHCDPHELQAIKDAMRKNPRNSGVGVLHEPTGRIYLVPFDDVGGHVGFVRQLRLPEGECKGFGIGINPAGTFTAANISQLNGPLGQAGALCMPPSTFATIVQALQDAGL